MHDIRTKEGIDGIYDDVTIERKKTFVPFRIVCIVDVVFNNVRIVVLLLLILNIACGAAMCCLFSCFDDGVNMADIAGAVVDA